MSGFPAANHVRECPYGHGGSQFQQIHISNSDNYRSSPLDPKSGWQAQLMGYFKCVVCGGPLFVRTYGPGLSFQDVFPHRVPTASEDIPSPAREIFLEAQRCQSVNAWNATGAMCRRAIQEAVLIVGGKGATLYQQIEDLAARNVIVDDLRAWAHTVRVIGRDGAHADVLTDVTESDADDALKFTEEFLEYNFILKKRLGRRIEKAASAA